jgi:CubicO group peptidase (beta-lactamase class C family)
MKKNTQVYRLLFILHIILNTSYIVSAQTFENKIDSLIQTEFNDINGPGGVFMVAKNGKTIYQKAFGKANLEFDIDLSPENVFQIGSMTKQFTAVAILMLEEQGKLNVNHSISKYIPDYPLGDKITIHHLLTHTSGIKDFTRMKSIREIAQKDMTPEMLVNFFKNEPVDFLPGEKFDYNNSGYALLGYIIELVSGETYEDFIKKNIFSKAGMTQSYYANDRQIINKRAYGYHEKEYGYINKTIINFSVPFASGSLMSSSNDMLKWQNALNQNLFLNIASTKKAFSKYKLNNGEEFTYGYGWHILEIKGTPTREHGGSIFGFKSMGVYIPSEDIYVIGLSNCDCHSPTKITRSIAAFALQKYKSAGNGSTEN